MYTVYTHLTHLYTPYLHPVYYSEQVRGSIPVSWSQKTSASDPRPPIIMNKVDPEYCSTQRHVADLFQRYAAPLIVRINMLYTYAPREGELVVVWRSAQYNKG